MAPKKYIRNYRPIERMLKALGFTQNARLFGQVGWVVIPYGAQQIVRLGTNIVLARLLAPEFFGIMLLVNALRTGAELLSDIGIGQSVVRSPNGEDRRFLNVAWTLQLVRGLCLTAFMLAMAWPISRIYERPQLFPIIAIMSSVFFLSGIQSPALFLLRRNMRLQLRALYEMSCIVFQCVFSIILAYLWPDVWSLVWSLVVSVFFSSAMSFLIDPERHPRLAWDRIYLREILHFGKWIFLSTMVYFAATSYDRMYFVAALSMSTVGVYGVSRTFADTLGSLAQRTGTLLVFPRMAALQNRGVDIAGLRVKRRHALVVVAVATGIGIAGADQFILVAYDPRYQAAAFMVPFLLVAAWFGVLAAFADSMLMGSGLPSPGAFANVTKLVVLVAGLPIAISDGSLLGALVVLLLAEMARWAALIVPSTRARFTHVVDDLRLTGTMMLTALIAKFVLGSIGIVPTLSQWWAMRTLLHL